MKRKTARRLVSSFISLVVGFSFVLTSYAWGGYTHWEMGQRGGQSLIASEKTAYSSGCLVADLGKSTWDNSYTSSDSQAFTNKIVEIANATANLSQESKSFAYGFKSHYIQDTNGAVANIQTSKTFLFGYRQRCGWVDKYFKTVLNINCPVNSTAQLFVNYDLIRNTYVSLNNFSPTNAQIDTEITDLYSLINSQMSLASSQGFTTAEKASIEQEVNRTVSLCNTSYTAAPQPTLFTAQDNTTNNKQLIKEWLNKFHDETLCGFKKEKGKNEGEYYLTFEIYDHGRYNALMNLFIKELKEHNINPEDLLN